MSSIPHTPEWTPTTMGYMLFGLAALILGAALQIIVLVGVGGFVLAWLATEAMLLRGKTPQATLSVSPARVSEGTSCTVEMEGEALSNDHQIHVPLSDGLGLKDGSNVVRASSNGDADEEGLRHTFDLDARVRGPQEVGPIEVRLWSPSRLWSTTVQVGDPIELHVVPMRLDAEDLAVHSRVLKPFRGRFQINQPGEGVDFFNLREYHPTDSIRKINWKASARVNDLIVNQRVRETQGEILILLDGRLVSGTGPLGKTPLDRGCRVGLSLFEEAVGERDLVRFLSYGAGVTPLKRQRSNRVFMLESMLSSLVAEGEASSLGAWRSVRTKIGSPGPIFIITSAEGDMTLPQTVYDMVGRGHPVTVFSPRPVGPFWEESSGRQEARQSLLDAARDAGGMVVDWKEGQPIYADAAPQHHAIKVKS